MPLNLPTGQRGQMLAAALAMIVLIMFWMAAISPLLDFYSGRADEIAQAAARIAREEALIKSLPALRRAAADASIHHTQAVLSGDTDAIAGAALQEQVQNIASNNAISPTSIETLPAEQIGAYRRIAVRVEMSAALTSIVAIMRAVEEASPTMLIDDIHFTATPTAATQVALPMDASFTVIAFRKGTAPREDQTGAKESEP